jgi:hypothetical protein
MARVILEIEIDNLYRLLKSSAETHQVSLEEECCRRLEGRAALVTCRRYWRSCAPKMNSGAPSPTDYFFF